MNTSTKYYFLHVCGAPKARGPWHVPLLPYRLIRHWLTEQCRCFIFLDRQFLENGRTKAWHASSYGVANRNTLGLDGLSEVLLIYYVRICRWETALDGQLQMKTISSNLHEHNNYYYDEEIHYILHGYLVAGKQQPQFTDQLLTLFIFLVVYIILYSMLLQTSRPDRLNEKEKRDQKTSRRCALLSQTVYRSSVPTNVFGYSY